MPVVSKSQRGPRFWSGSVELVVELMHILTNAEFQRSRSPPILHLNRWLPKSGREQLKVHVDGKRICRGAFTLIFIAMMNSGLVNKHPGYEVGTLKKAADSSS